MRPTINRSSIKRIVVALRNEADPDRPRRVAARLHDTLRPDALSTLAAMEVYKRLHGTSEALS